MKKEYKLTVAGLFCALIAGCGGGGGDDSQTPAEGFWQGTASNGQGVEMVILENGQTYAVYDDGAYLVGGQYGNTTSTGNSLSGSGKDFYIPTQTVTSGTFSGNFVAQSSLSVQFSNGVTLKASYAPSYDQSPPSLSTIAGTYTGSAAFWVGPTQTITTSVSSSGEIRNTSPGCTTSGTLKPRASGKNVFDVALSSQGTSCALGNGSTVQGVAVYFPASSRVLVMAANAASTNGFIYSANK